MMENKQLVVPSLPLHFIHQVACAFLMKPPMISPMQCFVVQSRCSPTRAFLLARPRSTTVSLSFPDECQARPFTWQAANLQKLLLAGAREGMEYSICCLNNLKTCPSVLLQISSFDLYFPTLCDVVLITSARQCLGTSSSMKQLDGCTGYEMLIQFPH